MAKAAKATKVAKAKRAPAQAKSSTGDFGKFIAQLSTQFKKDADIAQKKLEGIKSSIEKHKAKVKSASVKKAAAKAKFSAKKNSATKAQFASAEKAHKAIVRDQDQLKAHLDTAKNDHDKAQNVLKRHSGLAKAIELFHAKWDKKEALVAKKKAKSAGKGKKAKSVKVEAEAGSPVVATAKKAKATKATPKKATAKKAQVRRASPKKAAINVRTRARTQDGVIANATHH